MKKIIDHDGTTWDPEYFISAMHQGGEGSFPFPFKPQEGHNMRLEEWCQWMLKGDYPQGQSFLRKRLSSISPTEGLKFTDVFCCFGVASEYAVSEGVIPPAVMAPETERDQIPRYVYGGFMKGSATHLPVLVFKWLGLTEANPPLVFSLDWPLLNRDGDLVYLTVLNDHGMPFEQIVDLIRFFFMTPEEEG